MKPKNLPREELLKRAQEAIDLFEQQGNPAHVNFKFTCEKCGARVALCEPNMLYENGECYKCGHITKITHGGFTLSVNLQAGKKAKQ
jgi:hypothetical protein